MNLGQTLLIGFFMTTGAGCSILQSASISDIPKDRSKPVEVEKSRWIFAHMNFNTNLADEVKADLAKKCPEGRVSGILVKNEAQLYLLDLLYRHRVKATGYCDYET